MSEGKQRAIEALEKAGYRKVRENPGFTEYLHDTTRHIATLEGNLAIIIVPQAGLPALLAPGYAADQTEGATRSLVRLMNLALRSAKVDYQFDEGDAWSDMQKRLAVTWGAPGKRCELDEGKEATP